MARWGGVDLGRQSVPDVAKLVKDTGDRRDVLQGRKLCIRLQQEKLLRIVYLANLVIEMYGKCGSVEEAKAVFDSVQSPNLFTWTMMLEVYSRNGDVEKSREIFDGMPVRDVAAWNAMIVAYAQAGQIEEARSLFESMMEKDIVSWSTMITGYAQVGYVEEAAIMFDQMPLTNVVAWTAMVAAYAQNGKVDEAQRTFDRMPETNLVSWNVILAAHATYGQMLHARQVVETMPERDVVSWNVTIAGYGQRGRAAAAQGVFEGMLERSLVSWNSVIQACSGSDAASTLFSRMVAEGASPDGVTFTTLLNGCSFRGNVRQSWRMLVSMVEDHDLSPSLDHYHCLLDLLGRAGLLGAADVLTQELPFKPDSVTWNTVLAASKVNADQTLGADAACSALRIHPGNETPYLLISSMLSSI